jgi:DNA polymerase
MSVAERAAREQKLANAAAAVARCVRCPDLVATRRTTVFGEGDSRAQLVVIGEGPGETEDELGRPFVGRAGQLLDKMLLAIELRREDVFICNTVKCRPTFDDGVRLRNRPPTPLEMSNCRPYLDLQLEIVAPRAILCLGAPAAKSFLGPKFSISRQRGEWFDGPNGVPLIATFHPAYILRTTGGELEATKRLVWNDLKRVRAKLDEPPAAPEPAPVEQPSLFE